MARKKLNDGMYVGFSCIAFFIRNFSQCGIYKVYLELESSDQKRIVEFVPVNIGVIQRDLGATRVVHQLHSKWSQ